MNERHSHGPTIALNELSAAVNQAVERAQAARKFQVDKNIIMGRMIREDLAHNEAQAIAEQTVHALPAAMQHGVKPEVLKAGPGHIIIGIIYEPQAFER